MKKITKNQLIHHEIIQENFSRMKYMSLVILGFSVFILISDFLPSGVWNEKTIGVYRILDIILAGIAVFSVFFFWFYKKDNFFVREFITKTLVFLVLVWSGIVTGLEFNAYGFSTFIFVILASVFILFIDLFHSILYLFLAFIALIACVYLFGNREESIVPIVFILIPILLISVLISWKNYRGKVQQLLYLYELERLNKALHKATENLSEEVEKRTKEIWEKSERLKKSEAKFKSFVENANDLIYQVSSEGIFTYVSPNWREITGFEHHEVKGKMIADFVHPDDLEPCMNFLNKVLQTGQKQSGMEYRVWHKNQEWRWHVSNASPLFDEQGKVHSYLGIARDITDKKIAEETIRKNETLFNKVLETIPDLVSIHDENLNVVYSNWKGFGNVAAEKRRLGSKCYEVYRNQKDICPDCMAKKVFKLKKSFQIEVELPNGLWYDVRVIPILEESGDCNLFVEWVRDLTEKKKQEKELEEKNISLNLQNKEYEKLNKELQQINKQLIIAREKALESDRLKSIFLNNMSHEVRTPMNGIVGFAEFLQNENLSHDKRLYYSKIIGNNVKQLLKIIDGILDISTLEAKQVKPEFSEFSLNDFLMNLFVDYTKVLREKNIEFKLSNALSSNESTLISDKTALAKILHNLIDNAVKYTHQGFIEYGYSLSALNGRQTLTFFVKDSGIGIDKPNHAIVFERFGQADKNISANYGGTGLGLSIAKAFVELLGGEIWFESELGKGSIFYFTIPYLKKKSGQ